MKNIFLLDTGKESYLYSMSDGKLYISDLFEKGSVKKICLTNDTSLIEYGAQAIDNLFLTFSAENQPDCVEVEKWLDDEGKKFYILNFPQEKTKTKELLKEIIKNDEELKLYETESKTPEEDTLEKIKFVLSCGNDAQAIRLLEKYGDLRESVYLKQKINLRNKQ